MDFATSAATDAANAMRQALAQAGIRASDIQTSSFSVSPVYGDYPSIAGFETNIGYRVTLPGCR